MIEAELQKGDVYIWRKDDPDHRSTLRVTQITRNMVRAVGLEPSAYQRRLGMIERRSFWNPKCIFLDECTAQGEHVGRSSDAPDAAKGEGNADAG